MLRSYLVPAVKICAKQKPARIDAIPMKSQSMKFLVVDDDDLDVEKITRGFGHLGLANDVIHARDGFEALEILLGTATTPALEGPYIVLLDINMPRMNGIELLEKIRGDRGLAHTPVVVMSTSDHPADVEAAYSRNVSGYFLKSMGKKKMHEALAALSSYWQNCELPLTG